MPEIADRKRIMSGAVARHSPSISDEVEFLSPHEENAMSMRNLANYSIAAFGGGIMLALSLSPASAFTLSGPSLQQPVVSAQIDKVWWRHGGWGWHHGWGGGWGGPHCWRNYWGHLRCNY
jgi:hypothetical protein